MAPRALITGGTGFVGHHVLSYFLDHTDWDLTALDSLTYAGNPDKVRLDPRLRIIYHDLRAPLDPDRTGPVDLVFNLASASHVDRSIESPAAFIENNVRIAVHMLEWARVVKPKLFLQFSTDEVYGPASDEPYAEWSVIAPSNPYAASKACQEAIAFSYWRTYGVPVVITNTMNVFGLRQHPEKFVPLAIEAIRKGEDVPIHGEQTERGWQAGSRHWIYADDVADALIFLVEQEPARYGPATRPDRYNVVGAEEVSNLEVAEILAECMGLPLHHRWVDFHTSRPGHDRRYALDGSKLAALGWKPTVGLREGLCRVVQG